MKIIIIGGLPSFNEYMRSLTSNLEEVRLKQQIEDKMLWGIKQSQVTGTDDPIVLKIRWYEKNTLRDAHNVVFAKKYIIEALVKANILNGKTRKYIIGFQDELFIDEADPRIEIELVEQPRYH